jgi:predicted site-specific integrase-resolvase
MKWIDIDELARQTGIHGSHLCELVKDGRIPCLAFPEEEWLFNLEQVTDSLRGISQEAVDQRRLRVGDAMQPDEEPHLAR